MKKKIFISIAFWGLLFLPALFVFARLFFGGTLFGGDAPYFYPDAARELFSLPQVLTERGIPFGGVNTLLWISPLMILYGALAKFLSLGSDLILRFLFLYPSLILSFLGTFHLTRYLKLSRLVQFFAAFIYVFNTYYLLLVDGGQVGVALAYGIFPFVILFLRRLVDASTGKNFLTALAASFVLCVADPRIFAIAYLTVFVWMLLLKKFSAAFFGLLVPLVILNGYWIYPLFKNQIPGEIAANLGPNFLTLLNPLLLFSPHWPNNLFGKITSPPFYFFFVPILIFGGLFIGRKEKRSLTLVVLFLLFSFLTKGGSGPLGAWYDLLVHKVPFGSAFRDTSKFFMPVILFAGILIGQTIERFKSKIIPVLTYFYLLFLISPALFGKLNFLLSDHRADSGYQVVYENLKDVDGEFRTVWFTKKDSLSYETRGKPAIDGAELANFRPFAAINASEDVFNFLNKPGFVDWFRVLNVKYVFLNGDARNIDPTETDIKNWNTIKTLMSEAGGLTKLDWGTDFDAFEVQNVLPRSFSVNSLVAVIGPDLPVPTPAVYFEDGKWDPAVLLDKNPESVKVLFNGKGKSDLTMSFLQKYFVGPAESSLSQWAYYSAPQYLKYKYELLIRGFEFKDFDYGLGIGFSTNSGEMLKFKFDVASDGKYIIAKRVADIKNQNLSWEIEEVDLGAGSFEYQILNESEVKVLNVIALIPKEEFARAQNLAEETVGRFKEIKKTDLKDLVWAENGFWRITTDNFNPSWNSVPAFSMVNGYYSTDKK